MREHRKERGGGEETLLFLSIRMGRSCDDRRLLINILLRLRMASPSEQQQPSSLFQLFQRVGNPMFASYLGHLPTYLLFLVDFLRKTNLPTDFPVVADAVLGSRPRTA